MGKGGFKELIVWQKAKDLAVTVYRITREGSFKRDFSLSDQMRRAAISISSNIAEGDQRETDKEAVRFFYIAKGSAAELMSQSIIAFEIGYLDNDSSQMLENSCAEISSMLAKLISARARTFRSGPAKP